MSAKTLLRGLWRLPWAILGYVFLAGFVVCIAAMHGLREAAYVWGENT